MSLKTFVRYAILLVLLTNDCGPNVEAQTVQVQPKQGAQGWDISYSRRFSPEVFEADTTCATLAAAQREAASLKSWSNRMDPTSDWRLAVILIEGADQKPDAASGKDTTPATTAGPKLPSFHDALEMVATTKKALKDPLKAIEDKLEPKKGLKDYVKNIEGAYGRAKKAKEDMLQLTGKTIDTELAKVNSLVDKYNSEAQSFGDTIGFNGLPKMTRLGDNSLERADEWRKAKNEQFNLEIKKQQLDEERTQLDTKRQALLDDFRNSGDPAPPELQERAKKYRELVQKYDLEMATYESDVKTLNSLIGKMIEKNTDEQPAQPKAPVLDDILREISGTWIWDAKGPKVCIFVFKSNGEYRCYAADEGGVGSRPYEIGRITRVSQNNDEFLLSANYYSPISDRNYDKVFEYSSKSGLGKYWRRK